MGYLLSIVILAFVIIFIVNGFKIINQAQVMIVERLGRFNRILEPGLNFIIPIIDAPRPINWKKMVKTMDGQIYPVYQSVQRIDLRESVFDFSRQNVIKKDNVTI